MNHLLRKTITLLVGLSILLLSDYKIFASDSNVFTLTGPGLNGYNENGVTPVIFEIQNDKKEMIYGYCGDITAKVVVGSQYKASDLYSTNQFGNKEINQLAAILYNSYPYITIEEMQEKSGISYIKKKEAITAIQYAIWHYTNNTNFNSSYEVVNELYKYLINLKPITKNDNMELKVFLYLPANNVKSQILIGLNENNETTETTTGETTTGETTTGETTTKETTTEETKITKKGIIKNSYYTEKETVNKKAAAPRTADTREIATVSIILVVAISIIVGGIISRKKEIK